MDFPADALLQLLIPLYGETEGGDYCEITFKDHHIEDLGMTPTVGDASLYYRHEIIHGVKSLQGLSGLVVDDSLQFGNQYFKELKTLTEKKFRSKPRDHDDVSFSVMRLRKDGNCFEISKTDYIWKLQFVKESCSMKEFRSIRGQLAWICHTRPDIAFYVAQLSQVTEADLGKDAVDMANKVIRHLRKTKDWTLRSVSLDPKSSHIAVYTDSSFANNKDLSSQLGVMVFLVDESSRCNLIHFSSNKAKRVTKSVLGAELHAFADGLDFAFALKHDLENIILRQVAIKMFTDSKSLFDIMVKMSYTSEKRLMIDDSSLREAYEKEEISDVAWIRSEHNSADGLTKGTKCEAMRKAFLDNHLNHPIEQWVIKHKVEKVDTARSV